MIEVYPNLYVGGEDDEAAVRAVPGWVIVSAAKEPWHRAALGYTGRAAPRDHPEYLVAIRPGKDGLFGSVILNLVDVDDPRYVANEIMGAAVQAIGLNLQSANVLVHCNQGGSRGPSVALWAMHKLGFEPWASLPFDAAVATFKVDYPAYAPAGGIAGWLEAHW